MKTGSATVAEDQRVKSYADTTVGIVNVYIPACDDRQLHDRIVRAAKQSRHDEHSYVRYHNVLTQYFRSLDNNFYVHEWGHILQTISYPYLYVRSIREMLMINSLLKDIQDDDQKNLPLKVTLEEQYGESLNMNACMFRLDLGQAPSITLALGGTERPGRFDIPEIELLEEDVSIFEFKIAQGEYAYSDRYAHWLRRGRH